MTYILTDNVIGPYSGKKYGAKDDEVTLISNHDNVVIVEKDGIRFPVKHENIKEKQLTKPNQILSLF